MEMIEKVAKAIYEADPEGGYDPEDPNTVWRSDAWRPEVWEGWVGIAKAAIQAMRGPTAEMLIDAGTIDNYDSDYEHHVDADHIKWWQAMIDAALSGKSGMGEG